MSYRICTRCVMDNLSDESITFKENGTCNYCNDVLSRKDLEYFPNDTGKAKLMELVNQIKEDCKDDKYDCMVGVSGGLDSSYVIYLGYKMGLRMLAVHIDDGFDTETATKNIHALCEKAKVKLIEIKPDAEQYNDLVLSFVKASVPNLAFPQDNILFACLYKYARENKIKYSLTGFNFAHECILERGKGNVNALDKTHLIAIHKRFGSKPIDKLPIMSLSQRYIFSRYFTKVKSVKPLNYIDYNVEKALKELNDFCGFEYYGGKHYESILTRYLQCYYLIEKYKEDKRKSHYSSLIVNGQMTRDEALEKLKTNPYIDSGLYQKDVSFIANKLGISEQEFNEYINRPPKREADYPNSVLNKMAPLARKLRHFLG